jgi:hypothetical protein
LQVPRDARNGAFVSDFDGCALASGTHGPGMELADTGSI